MTAETIDRSKKRFLVSIYEIRQEFVFAEEFSGKYTKTVTLANGRTRTVELTPMMRDGAPVVELQDTGHCSYMGTLRVATATTFNGNLMIHVADLDELGRQTALPEGTSLLSIPQFVPPDFAHGIEILNDSTTPMHFVVAVLSTQLGLSHEDANRAMLAIHTRGGALLPTPSLAEARQIAAQITAQATQLGYPLRCRAVAVHG